MLAARFHRTNEPLSLDEVAVPRPGPGQVLVEVRACGLCGSDVHILKGETLTGKVPITLGHEAAGVIAGLGEGVASWSLGQRVAVNCVMSCGTCRNCQRGRDSICLQRRLIGIHEDGALARFVTVRATSLVPIPESLSFEQAAILTDAVATPYHALATRAALRAGEAVAIYGLGGLGAHAVKLARLLGATPVIGVDLSASARDRARRFGADATIDAGSVDPVAAVRNLTDGRGVDVALECVGSTRTLRQAVESTAVGGRAVAIGLSDQTVQLGDIATYVRSEVAILGSSAFETKEISQLVHLVATGRLDLTQSVTDTLRLDQVNDGLGRLMSNAGDILRLVVNEF